MNCLIVDDNEIARSVLLQLASRVSGLTVLGECTNAIDAFNFLQRQPADLLLLDIEMPGMSGIELTKNLGDDKPVIIFTTSKKDYAVEAFELNVADYLVKPLTPARFIQAIEKAKFLIENYKQDVMLEEEKVIFFRDSNTIRRVDIEDILFAEAMGDYVKLHLPQKFYAIHTTLKSLEEKLPSSKFIRVHRSFIVALNKIGSIKEGNIFINEKQIPVADAYRSALNKKIKLL